MKRENVKRDATQPPDARTIADAANAVLAAKWPTWSVDELLKHPADAMWVCSRVRRRLSRPALQDHEILGALLNGRKRGWFPPILKSRRGK